ncbi:MAG TPA: hypothetical protein VH592_14090 [Gemmataceae bacterium]
MLPVVIRQGVVADILTAAANSRATLGQILHDLNNHLPRNLAQYQPNRCLPKNPGCFWYERTYSLDPHAFKIRLLRFVVRDSDPSMLDVIWVVVVP